MENTVTLSVRSLVVTAATTLAVLAAYLIGSTQSGSSTARAAEAPSKVDEPSIVMTGSGEATGVPDQLKFSLTIRAHAADVSTALQSSSAATRRVVQAVRAHDIAFKDVQTTGLSINATYDYSGDGPPVITGYAASQSMSVLVRELPDAGATISDAVSAGGNAVRLHDVRLQIGDEDALLEQARAAAFAEAQAKAEQYAAEAGRPLGDVASVREVQVTPRVNRVYASAAFGSVEREASVPIRAGSADLRVTVSVVWSFG